MMNVKRVLKKQASQLLPDQNFKEKVVASVIPHEQTKKATSKKAYKIGMFASALSVCAVVLIAALVVTLALPPKSGIGNGDILRYENYISLEINPKFEILTDKNDKVKSISPLNKDAALVLFETNYLGLDVNSVCNSILLDTKKLGLMSDANPIKIVAFNSDSVKEKAIQNSLKNTIQSFLDDNSISKPIEVVKSEDDGSTNSATRKKLEKLALDLGVSQSEISNMTVEALARKIAGYNEQEINSANSLLKQKLNDNIALREYKQKIDKLDKMEDLIEDATEFVKLGQFEKAQEKINQYNSLCEELSLTDYKYNKLIQGDIETIKDELDDLEDKFDKYEESIEEEYEKLLENAKLTWKAEIEDDD